MKMWTQHFIGELDMVSVARAFIFAIVVVASYAFVAMTVARLYFKNKLDKSGLEILRRAFVRLPFLLTGYGLLTGLVLYFGILMIDSCFTDGHPHPRSNRPATVLLILPLCGFFASAYTGCAIVYKIYKILHGQKSTEP